MIRQQSKALELSTTQTPNKNNMSVFKQKRKT